MIPSVIIIAPAEIITEAPANQSNPLTPPQILTKLEDVAPRGSVQGQDHEMSAVARKISTVVILVAEVETESAEVGAINGGDVPPHVTPRPTLPHHPKAVASITKRVSAADPVIARRRAGNLSRRTRNEKCRLA
jgi:hypothetical protein